METLIKRHNRDMMTSFDPTLMHPWLVRSAVRYPDKAAVICGRQTLTYAQLDRQSDRLAAHLRHTGLARGDRVVIFLDNSVETVIGLYAILKAAGVFVILNSGLKPSKLAFILTNSDARFLITSPQKTSLLSQAFKEVTQPPVLIFTSLSESTQNRFPDSLDFQSLVSEDIPASCASPPPRIIDQDLAALIYTSGSTGQPKGVMSTHQNMISAARSIIQYIRNQPEDILLDVLPLSFDYGLYQVLMSVMFGGTVVLEKSFLYFHQVLQKIAEQKITGFPIVPTIVAMLLNMHDLKQYDFSTLRYITNTGAALPVEHIRRFRALFPDVAVISMFGLTECKRVGYLPPEQIDIRPASVGKAMPNCETRIIDEQGNPVPPGQPGELIIRGSNVMAGYWKDPQLTDRVFRTDPQTGRRWLYSGDIFKEDAEGYLYFLGRKDDMIKTRGERVSPKEIENILSQMPQVAEVAVIGVPDPILGQVPKAFIVSAGSPEITPQQVLQYAARNMENFMVPKEIICLESLPKTPNGKIDKKKLKE